MEHTEYYQLSLWEQDDRILREDFNADNAKIDAALAACGNCKIATGSYVGTGQYGSTHKNTLTFDFAPKLVIAARASTGLASYGYQGYWSHSFIWTPGMNYVNVGTGSVDECPVTVAGNTFTWYSTESAAHQLNTANNTYFYIALGE